ncbi:Negative transcriptional regulator [Macrophomina phaseolina MS6]|uniref:Negative transcriptional regulator n=2 Tax=Macrophomina phaseolina TaxID=35725 RepID=K2RP44_MACPH|nr:Negative transcriptional regulator [Macrophomina phaseolina MS6]KAH7057409.1 putative FMN-binding domain-containing protein [Macrophomina phaseolina]
MYLRAIHAEHHIPTLRAFIRAHPLGIFTTAIASPSNAFPLLQSSHIPWLLDVGDESSETELGVLRGHLARANPQSKAMIEHLSAQQQAAAAGEGAPRTLEHDVLILFNAPAHHYVSPKFYVETKPATGKVVPTWDYAAVQVYGKARVYFDARSGATDAFLQKAVADLSERSEREIMGHEQPWRVEDAPKPYVEALKKAIIGVEVEITDMAGKWKMSQEMPEGDRKGVASGFEALGSELGREVAEMVREREDLMVRRKAEEKA